MSAPDCKAFTTELAYEDGESKWESSKITVTHSFRHESGGRDGGVLMGINSGHGQFQVHTTEKSLLAFAMRVIKELAP